MAAAAAAAAAEPQLIGRGSYGCVFRPPLPCASAEHVEPGARVGKTFLDTPGGDPKAKVFSEELEAYRQVKTLDPTGLFHVPEAGYCKVASAYETCAVAAGDQQLLMEDGGILLAQWLRDGRRSEAELLEACEPLFLGLARLSAAGLFHFDVLYKNIMFSGGKLRYIDLGLVKPYSEVMRLRRVKGSVFQQIYEMYPIEWDYNPRAEVINLRHFGAFVCAVQESNPSSAFLLPLFQLATELGEASDAAEYLVPRLLASSNCFRANQYALGASLIRTIARFQLPVSPTTSRFGRALLKMVHWDPAQRFDSADEIMAQLWGAPPAPPAAAAASAAASADKQRKRKK